jgi:transcriptional regulator with XRE-family HTH domain
MTTEQLQTEQPIFNETPIRERLISFRLKHVEKSQRKAATLIEIPQTTLSRYESGERGLNLEILHAYVSKFHLNANWAVTGEGESRRINEPKSTLMTNIDDLSLEMGSLKKYIKVMEARQNKLFNIIEKLEEEIEVLKKK